jgi:hypothetical protein
MAALQLEMDAPQPEADGTWLETAEPQLDVDGARLGMDGTRLEAVKPLPLSILRDLHPFSPFGHPTGVSRKPTTNNGGNDK